jgi:hypothetical protein
VIEAVRTTAAFVLLIAPGFLMVSGYSRRRFHRPPVRDLYALAQAVIASAIWLAMVWLVLLALGDPLKKWGLVPLDTDELAHHRSDIVLLGLAVAILPYAVGALGATLVDWLSIDRSELSGQEAGTAFRFVRRLGVLRVAKWARLLQHPTAWDRAWSRYTARQGAGKVVVRMKDGLLIKGAYGTGAQVDLSPSPPQLFLTQGYGYVEGEGDEERVEIGAWGPEGVFIQVAEIEAIYFGEMGEADGQGDEADTGGGGARPGPQGAGDGDGGAAAGEAASGSD